MTLPRHTILFLALLVSLMAGRGAVACPFCAAESRTLTEEMNDSSVVLLGKLVAPPGFDPEAETPEGAMPGFGFVDPETGAALFRIEQVLFGQDALGGAEEVRAIYVGTPDLDRMFFIRGIGEPADWAIPLPLSETAAAYVPKLLELPESGADRMEFFLDYLQHEDSLLSQDAYDEFARAPYQDVIDLADRMDREQLLAWVESPSVSPSRRRLFLTMLGVCGIDSDVDRLEAMLLSDTREIGPAAEACAAASLLTGGGLGAGVAPELFRFSERQRKIGLDAMIACYLTLSGKHRDASKALDLIDNRFLKDPAADYSHIYAALQALRFLAEEQQELIALQRVLASARLLLDSPDFADQVVPDLARWEDWSVLERLGSMYERSVAENREKYIREPIVTYLDVASEQEGAVGQQAIAALERIEPLDPGAVKRARSLRAFGILAQARNKPAGPPTTSPIASPIKLPPEPEQTAESPVAAPEGPSEPSPTETPIASEINVSEDAIAEAQAPNTVLLIGIPLVGAAVCMGVFWLILRGGVA